MGAKSKFAAYGCDINSLIEPGTKTRAGQDDDEAREARSKIADALVKYNPRLEPFKINYEEVARLRKISIEQARAQLNHIELNPPESDLAIQIEVQWDHVSITIPYWYTGNKAEAVFAQLSAYLRVIRETAGFFAYDPQTDRAFDPAIEGFASHIEYARIADNLPAIIAQGSEAKRKPWWKFW